MPLGMRAGAGDRPQRQAGAYQADALALVAGVCSTQRGAVAVGLWSTRRAERGWPPWPTVPARTPRRPGRSGPELLVVGRLGPAARRRRSGAAAPGARRIPGPGTMRRLPRASPSAVGPRCATMSARPGSAPQRPRASRRPGGCGPRADLALPASPASGPAPGVRRGLRRTDTWKPTVAPLARRAANRPRRAGGGLPAPPSSRTIAFARMAGPWTPMCRSALGPRRCRRRLVGGTHPEGDGGVRNEPPPGSAHGRWRTWGAGRSPAASRGTMSG